jgi:ribosomal-protein-alanine N-acetyltransferase
MLIATNRLDLIAATPDTLRAAIAEIPTLGRQLDAKVSRDWPPELLDADALNWTLAKLEDPANEPHWWLYWVVLRAPRTLIGTAGFKGPPVDGTVELGYGIVRESQRRGYASEATQGLIDFAFSKGVKRVIAETYPELVASIGVMTRCGMTFLGDGSEPRVIRYGVERGA